MKKLLLAPLLFFICNVGFSQTYEPVPDSALIDGKKAYELVGHSLKITGNIIVWKGHPDSQNYEYRKSGFIGPVLAVFRYKEITWIMTGGTNPVNFITPVDGALEFPPTVEFH